MDYEQKYEDLQTALRNLPRYMLTEGKRGTREVNPCGFYVLANDIDPLIDQNLPWGFLGASKPIEVPVAHV